MRIIYLFSEAKGLDFGVWSWIVDFTNYLRGFECETEIWYSGKKMDWEAGSITAVHLPSRHKDHLTRVVLQRQLCAKNTLFVTNRKVGNPSFWGRELLKMGFRWMNLTQVGFQSIGGIASLFSLEQKKNRYIFYEEPTGSLENILEVALAWQNSKIRQNPDFKLVIASNGAPEHEWQVMSALLELSYNGQIEYVGRLSSEDRNGWLRKADFFVGRELTRKHLEVLTQAIRFAAIPLLSPQLKQMGFCERDFVIGAGTDLSGMKVGFDRINELEDEEIANLQRCALQHAHKATKHSSSVLL